MKVALISDVHLEFGDCFIENTENAEVLILGGDIMISQELHDFAEPLNDLEKRLLGKRGLSASIYRKFLRRCSEQFKHVIYIAGNHEFYHGKYPAGMDYIRNELTNYPNITFLENEHIEINDVTFIGCTLWTDMNKGDTTTINLIRGMLNDYRQVSRDDLNYRKLQPEDTLDFHRESLEYISNTINENPNKKYIVVGHHAPCKLSTKPQYQKDFHMNGGYSSDLTEFISDHPQIVLWTHGHTHDKFDYMVGSTRIACNPRGYLGHEVFDEVFDLKFLDI
jgi:predicted phosphodiesterase